MCSCQYISLSKAGKRLWPRPGACAFHAATASSMVSCRFSHATESTIESSVSEYAATNFNEMLAEVWQEYSTMGDLARPGIREIGQIMRELAEEMA